MLLFVCLTLLAKNRPIGQLFASKVVASDIDPSCGRDESVGW